MYLQRRHEIDEAAHVRPGATAAFDTSRHVSAAEPPDAEPAMSGPQGSVSLFGDRASLRTEATEARRASGGSGPSALNAPARMSDSRALETLHEASQGEQLGVSPRAGGEAAVEASARGGSVRFNEPPAGGEPSGEARESSLSALHVAEQRASEASSPPPTQATDDWVAGVAGTLTSSGAAVQGRSAEAAAAAAMFPQAVAGSGRGTAADGAAGSAGGSGCACCLFPSRTHEQVYFCLGVSSRGPCSPACYYINAAGPPPLMPGSMLQSRQGADPRHLQHPLNCCAVVPPRLGKSLLML